MNSAASERAIGAIEEYIARDYLWESMLDGDLERVKSWKTWTNGRRTRAAREGGECSQDRLMNAGPVRECAVEPIKG